MLILVFATPHAFADDEEIIPTPLSPAANVKYAGYLATKTTGAPSLPASAARTGTGTGSPGPLLKGFPKSVCSIPGDTPGGIASGPGGQFIEDWYTGSLWFYNTATKTCGLLQHAPAGAAGDGYFGIAVKGSLVALISWDMEGLWTCKYSSTLHKCTSVSSFIPLPSTFCASMPYGYCNPDGIAFDKGKNLWYVDIVNAVEVELTMASNYLQVGTTYSYGSRLVGITIDSSGNHWVVDNTCSGNLYKNGVWKGSNGDDVEAIAISTINPEHTAQIYVTVENACGNYAYPFVGDMNDAVILPHPYSSGADAMNGISTKLYFTDWSYDFVWLTKDA